MKKEIINYITKSALYSFSILLLLVLINVFQACSGDDPTYGTPAIKEFTFSAGAPAGTLVRLTGTFFSATLEKNIVKFNGIDAGAPKKGTINSLTVVVPEGASTGKITVTVDGITGTSTSDFVVTTGVPQPGIVKFTPDTGYGTDNVVVTITGVNFSTTPSLNSVTFNDVDAAVPISATATTLTVMLPAGTNTGKIKVTVDGRTGTSDDDFTLPSPTITDFTPTFSIVGSTVIINGTYFSKNPANNVVKFNGIEAGIPTNVSVDDKKVSKLTVIVPVGAVTGKISITIDGQTGTSKDDFVVN